MPLFGAHMSAAGGVANAVRDIIAIGGDSLQLFTANQRQWAPRAPTDDEVMAFRSACEGFRGPVFSHASYLINVATGDAAAAEKAVDALARECERCVSLGVDGVVLHPGAHLGAGAPAGIRRAARHIDAAFDRAGAEGVMLLLENTAGQGTCLGGTLLELAAIMDASRDASRLGVCIDTAHAFGGGYALDTDEGYGRFREDMANGPGLDNVRLFHVNDSLAPCGSRKDRHTHIGQGLLGESGFTRLVCDPAFSCHPMILETPKEDGLEADRRNLAVLRLLAEGGPMPPAHR